MTEEIVVAEIVSAHGDPEAFGERDVVWIADINQLPYGTKLYATIPAPTEKFEPYVNDRGEVISVAYPNKIGWIVWNWQHVCWDDKTDAERTAIKQYASDSFLEGTLK